MSVCVCMCSYYNWHVNFKQQGDTTFISLHSSLIYRHTNTYTHNNDTFFCQFYTATLNIAAIIKALSTPEWISGCPETRCVVLQVLQRKLMFFSDVSAELHKKWKIFDTVKDIPDLNLPKIRYGFLYPASLCVPQKNKCHLFNNPSDTQRFLQDLKANV